MDDKGFIFTIDAALMLIPVFILVAAVANVNLVVPHETPYYTAQDALDALYYSDVTASVVNNVSLNTTQSKAYAINAVNNLYVFRSLNCPYALNYAINNGNEMNLTSSGTPTNGTISVARRVHGNVTLILYMWR